LCFVASRSRESGDVIAIVVQGDEWAHRYICDDENMTVAVAEGVAAMDDDAVVVGG
jgi:hypothetical protein